jgi:hypothetical protein
MKEKFEHQKYMFVSKQLCRKSPTKCLKPNNFYFCFKQTVCNKTQLAELSNKLWETKVIRVLFPAICLEQNNNDFAVNNSKIY